MCSLQRQRTPTHSLCTRRIIKAAVGVRDLQHLRRQRQDRLQDLREMRGGRKGRCMEDVQDLSWARRGDAQQRDNLPQLQRQDQT